MQYKKIKPLIIEENPAQDSRAQLDENMIFHGKSFCYVDNTIINCSNQLWEPAMKIRFVRGVGAYDNEVDGEIGFFTVDTSKLSRLAPGQMVELEVIVRPVEITMNEIY